MLAGDLRIDPHQEGGRPDSRGSSRVCDPRYDIARITEPRSPIEPVTYLGLVAIVDLNHVDGQIVIGDDCEVAQDVLRRHVRPVDVPRTPTCGKRLQWLGHELRQRPTSHRQAHVQGISTQVRQFPIRRDDDAVTLDACPNRRHFPVRTRRQEDRRGAILADDCEQPLGLESDRRRGFFRSKSHGLPDLSLRSRRSLDVGSVDAGRAPGLPTVFIDPGLRSRTIGDVNVCEVGIECVRHRSRRLRHSCARIGGHR